MPNWTSTHLGITPHGVLDHLIFNTEGEVDFNVLLPMPEILHRVLAPPRTGDNGRLMLDTGEATPAQQTEIDAQSHNNWREWALAHWGVKWNADACPDRTPTFLTPWDAPLEWLHQLAQHLPTGATMTAFVDHEDQTSETLHFSSE